MNRVGQANAAQWVASNPGVSAWVAANAGSGKTSVLANRVARLLLRGARPQEIVCLTYTKAAASVMQVRLFEKLGEWSMQQDPQLRKSLLELGEPATSLHGDVLARARTLFAAALETPGGLKIQTIHSFCDSIMRRFPIEAGVAPGFAVTDDNRTRKLLDSIVADMASDDRAAFDGIAAHMPAVDDGLLKLLKAILSKRESCRANFDESGFRAFLGLPEAMTQRSLLRQVLGYSGHDLLQRMQTVLDLTASVERKASAKITRILGAIERPPVHAMLEDLLMSEETKDKPASARIARWANGPTRDTHPALTAEVEEFAKRVEAARPHRLALNVLQSTTALHRFAGAFLARYAQAKTAAGLVDFDDQIQMVRNLLTNAAVAQWVLYRLDGGIAHILVDEAQDTSPAQWDVIKALTQDFYSGASANTEPRTIFAVGDEKQSIYSFQGADPQAFARSKDHYVKMLDGITESLEECDLIYSFRSAEPILRLADKVLEGPAGNWMQGPVRHAATDEMKPGRIELWDRVTRTEAVDPPLWFVPDDMEPADKPVFMLAEKIADWIRDRLNDGTVIPDGQGFRRLRPGDILILVQSRGTIFRPLLRKLKERNLPVAGADRLVLTDELAVKDILAVLEFIASPKDDLSLAAALRSPLGGISEQDLFGLAAGREGSTIWQRMLQEREKFAGQIDMLSTLRAEEGFRRPFELIEAILTRFDGRRKLVARLGEEVTEGIDVLLEQALKYEQSEVPTLTGFLDWIKRSTEEVQRQNDSTGNLIRIMTVHGAKGLEAPLVILPDTSSRPDRPRDSGISELPDGTLVWMPVSEPVPALGEVRDAARIAESEENHRLLYVALTRAVHWLVICGAEPVKKASKAGWYDLVAPAVDTLGPEARDGMKLVQAHWREEKDETEPAISQESRTLPDWKLRPAPAPDIAPRDWNPSDLGGSHALPGEDESASAEAGKRYGAWIHALLEVLPGCHFDTRQRLARSALDASIPAPGPTEFDAVYAEASALLNAPDLAEIFAPGTLAEVAFATRFRDRALVGRIDRLIVGPDRIVAVDFKSNRIVPESVAAVPEGILRQMGAYAHALQQIWPDRSVETAILWTNCGKLLPLPQNIVMAALERSIDP